MGLIVGVFTQQGRSDGLCRLQHGFSHSGVVNDDVELMLCLSANESLSLAIP